MSTFRHFERPGEPRLAFTIDRAEGTPRGRVLMIHGYADHSARYDRVVDFWGRKGLTAARFDLRGHGRSDGARGHVQSFEEYLRDVRDVLGHLEHDDSWKAGGRPILFGHSLGGLIAAIAAIELGDRLLGLAITSPFFGVAKPIPAVQKGLGNLVAKVAPRLRQASGLSGADMTHDKELAKLYDTDPFHFSHVTVGWFTAIENAHERALAEAPRLRVPLYCRAAGDDRAVSLDATRRFFERAGSPEKELGVQEGSFHELLNEPDWEVHATGLAERMLRWAVV